MSIVSDDNKTQSIFEDSNADTVKNMPYEIELNVDTHDCSSDMGNYKELVKSISTGFLQIISVLLKEYNDFYSNALETINNTLSAFSDVLHSLYSDYGIGITDEERNERIQQYSLWGKIGWTNLPVMNDSAYCCDPLQIGLDNTAEYILAKLGDGLEDIIETIKEANKSNFYFESAAYCFNKERYTECALLLFSIIDSKLIEHQVLPPPPKKRKTGSAAFNDISKDIQKNKPPIFAIDLLTNNLKAAIGSFFEQGKDFTIEPVVLNRNFLMHGMSKRPANKIDCIQLFLLLYNLEIFFSFFDGFNS